MKRWSLILLGIIAVVALGMLSSIVTHGFEELARARDERERLRHEKQRLEQRIDELEATLEALQSSTEAIESLARKDLGWVRPGDQVIILATPTPLPRPLPESLTDPAPTPILSLRD